MPNMAYINDFPRLKYHMGYWKLGDSAYQVQNCEFHCAFIDDFIKKFSGLGKYTILYLKCLSNGRVLIDKREVWNDRSLHSLIEDLKTVDLL